MSDYVHVYVHEGCLCVICPFKGELLMDSSHICENIPCDYLGLGLEKLRQELPFPHVLKKE